MKTELPASCRESTAEAMAHFRMGGSYDLRGKYANAIEEYNNALKAGFHDNYGLCQIMILAGINMGVLERKANDGTPDIKGGPEGIVSILKNAIEVSEQYLK
jgi:hypothetical protein